MNYGVMYYSKYNKMSAIDAAKSSKADYLLFLEENSVLHENAFDCLNKCIRSSDEKTVLFKLHQISIDNSVQAKPVSLETPFILDGAFAIKRSIYEKVGGLDENFNLLSFTDLSWRLCNEGYTLQICPDAIVKTTFSINEKYEYIHEAYEKLLLGCKWGFETERKKLFEETFKSPHRFIDVKAELLKKYVLYHLKANNFKKLYSQNTFNLDFMDYSQILQFFKNETTI